MLAGLRERAARGEHGTTIDYAEGVALDAARQRADGDDARIASGRRERAPTAISSSPCWASANARVAKPRTARISTCPATSRRWSKRWRARGKPVVVVLLTGRALAVPALVERSGALVHAFFPGIEGGHALADVLFGDYNPGGKEPVTWPRSVGQLPIHHYDPPNGRPNIPERGDYKAHWLDEPDEPLFAFGFGLSYSQFTLDSLQLPTRIGRDDTLTRACAADQHLGSRRRRSAAAVHPPARGEHRARASACRPTGACISAAHESTRGGIHTARQQARGAGPAGSLDARTGQCTK